MADPVSIEWNSLQTNNKTTPNVKNDWSEALAPQAGNGSKPVNPRRSKSVGYFLGRTDSKGVPVS